MKFSLCYSLFSRCNNNIENNFSLCKFFIFKLAKVFNEFEMSENPSQIIVNKDSYYDSDSETESGRKIDKYKNRKKQKNTQEKKDFGTTSTSNKQKEDLTKEINQMVNSTDDDETESPQRNYGESPIHSTSIPSSTSIYNQDKMRRRLQFFFMNPIEKWIAKRR